ncbi:MAG: Stp1/IreP family PP2C-type Ser/Thr phosphatase [Chlamydiales bacterium]
MQYKIIVYGLSDIGLVRQNNEDYWTQLDEDQLYVLADGMGGHRAGEVASREAAETVCLSFKDRYAACDKTLEGSMEALYDAICDVNRVIYRMGRQYNELRGMGTTLCCVQLHPDGLIYGHVGDSRIYRFRHQHLERLTRDHSLLRELIDLGQLSEQQADDFLYKNILTKAIGTEPSIEPSVFIDSLEVDDLILMCTDGLTDMLTDEDIETILKQTADKEAADKLLQTAIDRGGCDNVTIVLIKIQGKNESAHLS